MAYLMDDNAMRICIRPRPWHPEKELPFLSQHVNTPFFLGGGNFVAAPRKPAPNGSLREIVAVIDNRQIDFDKPEQGTESRPTAGLNGRRYKNRRYVFDHVFRMETTQDEVYENTAKGLLDGVLKGYNATVFAYGATGCGKTHTISGTPEDPGIIIRTMSDLFDRIKESEDKFETHIEMTMIELYNEQIRDLLNDNFPATPTGGLKLLENEKERVTIADVTTKEPKSVDEVMSLVMLGNERRSTSTTHANNQSSRSHAVLQISVTRSSKVADVDMERERVSSDMSQATLSIVDLAGSERASATRNMGARMKEGAKINQSLLALSSCISALCSAQRQRSRPHVPYRNSKLTRLLKFSLGGNCRTVMIVCVSPSSRDMEDTSNTLTWANKAKDVKMRISRNVGGREVTARQYLEKIAQQGDTIRQLEMDLVKLRAEKDLFKLCKLSEGQKRVAETMRIVQSRVDEGLAVIKEGAEQRARWDVAELGATASENRGNDLKEDDAVVDLTTEKGACDQLVTQFRNAYANNRMVQLKVRREAEHASGIEAFLKQTEAKTFPDMDEVNIQNLHYQVELQRTRVALAVSEAREAGYRAAVACTQEALARCSSAFARVDALVKQHEAALDDLVASGVLPSSQLQQLRAPLQNGMDMAHTDIANILASVGRTDALPAQPLRPPTQLHSTIAHTSAGLPALSPSPTKKTSSPAVKRIMQASEKKGGYVVGAPASPRPKAKAAKPSGGKVFRFADEAGEGELQTVHMFRPRSSNASSFELSVVEGEDSNAADWEELQDDLAPLPRMRIVSLPMPSIPAPFKVGGATTPPESTSTSTGGAALAPVTAAPPALSASAPASTADMPEWKKNRILLGKTGRAPSSSSPSSMAPAAATSGSKGPGGIGLGNPSRLNRPSLGELRQIPPGPRSSLMSSTLGKGASSEKPSSPSSAPVSGRRASVSRRDRPKLHSGAAPYKRNPSLIPSPVASPNGNTSPNGVSLGAGATRSLGRPVRMRPSIMDAGNTSITSNTGGALNTSLDLPSGKTLRHSMSTSQLNGGGGGTLRPRQSNAQLRESQIGRPAWR